MSYDQFLFIYFYSPYFSIVSIYLLYLEKKLKNYLNAQIELQNKLNKLSWNQIEIKLKQMIS